MNGTAAPRPAHQRWVKGGNGSGAAAGRREGRLRGQPEAGEAQRDDYGCQFIRLHGGDVKSPPCFMQ
jgi:hypothetical protein